MLVWLAACNPEPAPQRPVDEQTATGVDTDTDTEVDSDTAPAIADSGGTGATGATGDTGPTGPDARIGRVYTLDLAIGVWTEPPGSWPLLASLAGGGGWLLVSPTAVDASRIEWLAAPADGLVQDLCRPTATLDQTPWSDPDFAAVGDGLDLGVASGPLVSISSGLAGTFGPSGYTVNQVVVGGPLDTRSVAEGLGLGADPNAVCELISTFGDTCVACPDGSGDYCTRITVEQLTGAEVPSVVLVPRTQADIDADPTCR